MGTLPFGGPSLGWDEALARQVEEQMGPAFAKKVHIVKVDASELAEEED